MDTDGVRTIISLWNKRSVQTVVYVILGGIALALVIRDWNNLRHETRVAVNNFETLNCRDLSVHADTHTRNNLRSDCERLYNIMSRGLAAALMSRLFNSVVVSGAEIVIGVVFEFNTVFITVAIFVGLALALRVLNQYFTAQTPQVQMFMPPWMMQPPPNYDRRLEEKRPYEDQIVPRARSNVQSQYNEVD